MVWKKLLGLDRGKGDPSEDKKKKKKRKKKKIPAWEDADRIARAQDRELRRTFEVVSPEQEARERTAMMSIKKADLQRAREQGDEGVVLAMERDLRALELEELEEQLTRDESMVFFENGDSVRVPWQQANEDWKVGAVQEGGKVLLAEERSGEMRQVYLKDLSLWQDLTWQVARDRSVEAEAQYRVFHEDRIQLAHEVAVTISDTDDEDDGMVFQEVSDKE